MITYSNFRDKKEIKNPRQIFTSDGCTATVDLTEKKFLRAPKTISIQIAKKGRFGGWFAVDTLMPMPKSVNEMEDRYDKLVFLRITEEKH